MRGSDEQTAALFSYVSCEARVPRDHPLRAIRMIVDEALDVVPTLFPGSVCATVPEGSATFPFFANPASRKPKMGV